MFPETFEIVLRTISSELRATNNATGKIISEEKQLLIATWLMIIFDSNRNRK